MKIPITKPYFTRREEQLLHEVLRTGWIVQGPYVQKLEEMFCRYTGSKYAVATNSCTSAQFIASRCIDLQRGDEVIVPAFTWISTANAAEFLGAKPVFVDIDIDTFNIDADDIERKITYKTRAIFPVNLFGLPADLHKIRKIAKKYKLAIIEDCACSLGGRIGNVHTGNFGICGCFSLHPRKSITTGEGGMLITNSQRVAKLASSLRNHGASRTDLQRHDRAQGLHLGEYSHLGYNFRMTDIQAAIGVAQFEKLDYILSRRKEIAQRYYEKLSSLSYLKLPVVPPSMTHGYQSFVCLFLPETINRITVGRDIQTIKKLSRIRNQFMLALHKGGIATRQGTHAVHIQQYYAQKYNIKPLDFPHAYLADHLSISLPLYPQMTKREQDFIIKQITSIGVRILCAV